MICVALQRICHLNLKMLFTFKLSFEKTFLTCHWAWSNVQDCYLLLKSNLQRNINFSKEISNSKHHLQFLIITIDKTIFDNAITQPLLFGFDFPLFLKKKMREVSEYSKYSRCLREKLVWDWWNWLDSDSRPLRRADLLQK